MKIEFKDATIADVIMTIVILGGYAFLQNFIVWEIALLLSLLLGVLVHDIVFIAKLKWSSRKHNKESR